MYYVVVLSYYALCMSTGLHYTALSVWAMSFGLHTILDCYIHLPTSVAPVVMALFSESIRARRGLSSRVCAQVDAAKSKHTCNLVHVVRSTLLE